MIAQVRVLERPRGARREEGGRGHAVGAQALRDARPAVACPHVVDEHAHLDAALVCGGQRVRERDAGAVGVEDVAEEPDRALGALDRGQHARVSLVAVDERLDAVAVEQRPARQAPDQLGEPRHRCGRVDARRFGAAADRLVCDGPQIRVLVGLGQPERFRLAPDAVHPEREVGERSDERREPDQAHPRDDRPRVALPQQGVGRARQDEDEAHDGDDVRPASREQLHRAAPITVGAESHRSPQRSGAVRGATRLREDRRPRTCSRHTVLAFVLDSSGPHLVKDRPAPTVAAETGEVRVRMLRAGVCNTDLELARGYMGFQGVLGHEFVGTVLDGALAGRRAVAGINFGCGRCDRCKAGLERHCPQRRVLGILDADGAMAEELVVPERNLHVVPDTVGDDEAVFAEPLAAACEILDQLADMGRRPSGALVLGAGKLGPLIAQALAAAGHEVELVGRHLERLEWLRDRGVALRDTLPAGRRQLVVEATGSAEGLAQAIGATEPRGTLVLKTTRSPPATRWIWLRSSSTRSPCSARAAAVWRRRSSCSRRAGLRPAA